MGKALIININQFMFIFLTSGDTARDGERETGGKADRERIKLETLFHKWLTQVASANDLAGSLDIILSKISSKTPKKNTHN